MKTAAIVAVVLVGVTYVLCATYEHWQNLNERPGGRDAEGRFVPGPEGIPYHARAWFRFSQTTRLQIEWHLLSMSCRWALTHDSEGWRLSIALPPVALYFNLDSFKLGAAYGSERELRWAIHDWAIWWNVWTQPHEWSCKTPRWRNGSWHFLDTFLGKRRHSTRPLGIYELTVQMPEGSYPAKVSMEEATWKRLLWVPLRITRAYVELATPIPVPGKGENSWDCEDDATYSLTTPARNAEDAIGKFTGYVLERRRRYGGRDWCPKRLPDNPIWRGTTWKRS